MNNVLCCLRCIHRKIKNINSFRINNRLIYLLSVATHGHASSHSNFETLKFKSMLAMSTNI
jgi:hypothetical protein